ncbi:hypothetical protein BSKO_09326 [Bryopsis sp. KO-2023]|nr:hypothetical protein BSKO_09326 [Bryopsis sp. KO-2023]
MSRPVDERSKTIGERGNSFGSAVVTLCKDCVLRDQPLLGRWCYDVLVVPSSVPEYEFVEGDDHSDDRDARDHDDEFVTTFSLPRTPSVASLAEGVADDPNLCPDHALVKMFLEHLRENDYVGVPDWSDNQVHEAKEDENGQGIS